MATFLNIIFLFPALGLLGEFARVRFDVPVDEQAGLTAYEDRMLMGAVFGALLPALLNGSAIVLLGVFLVLAGQAYVVMETDRAGMALIPTPHFRSRNIEVHQNMVLGLAGGGALAGFIVSLIFGAIANGIFGLFLYCLLYTSPSPRDATLSRMPSSA